MARILVAASRLTVWESSDRRIISLKFSGGKVWNLKNLLENILIIAANFEMLESQSVPGTMCSDTQGWRLFLLYIHLVIITPLSASVRKQAFFSPLLLFWTLKY